MRSTRIIATALAVLFVTATATPSFAQRRGSRAGGGGGATAGRAVPRGSYRPAPGPRTYAPANRGYRGPAVRTYNNFYAYGRYGYPWGWYGSGLYGGFYYGNWGFPYSWGLAYRSSPYWGYGYGYPGYGYGYGYPGYAVGVRADGGIRLDLDVRDAQVFVDGYYAGLVDDFDGSLQQLRLSPGPHRIEIERDGFDPVSFEVRVEPGRTITYRTQLRPTP